jgi:hypothetical protein
MKDEGRRMPVFTDPFTGQVGPLTRRALVLVPLHL